MLLPKHVSYIILTCGAWGLTDASDEIAGTVQNALKDCFLMRKRGHSSPLNAQQWLTLAKSNLSASITKPATAQPFETLDGNAGRSRNSALKQTEIEEFSSCGLVGCSRGVPIKQ